MKPYIVILQVRPRGTVEPLTPSRPVPVYGTDGAEAVERAKRLLEMDLIDAEYIGAVVTEGWPRGVVFHGMDK